MLEVSRAAFYARRHALPGPRAIADALTERIAEVHRHSRGTYGVPRIHAVLHGEGRRCGRLRGPRGLIHHISRAPSNRSNPSTRMPLELHGWSFRQAQTRHPRAMSCPPSRGRLRP
ncbi:IS3 family transposase [Microtetraspora malaysiensis]|uniref:IS3 family transposase n=1 Tax=Microtetraspora malaysiensis TaxID=161358 RepID=A0ABW6T409_9ACTN